MLEHRFTKTHGVVGKPGYSSIGIEGAIGRDGEIEAKFLEACGDRSAIGGIAGFLLFGIVAFVESSGSGYLAEGGRGDKQILLQHFSAANEGFGEQHPA